MDLGALRALALDLNFSAHGVPVTVTRTDEVAIDTRGIWLVPVNEAMPLGTEFTRREPIRVLALRRDVVATIPRGAVIVAPEKSGDTAVHWTVDGFERQEADHHRVIVRRLPDED